MRQAEASAAPTARAPAKLLVRQAAAPGPGWTRVPSRPKDCPLGATPRGGQPHRPPAAAGSPLVPSGAWRGNHRRHRLHGDPPAQLPVATFTHPLPQNLVGTLKAQSRGRLPPPEPCSTQAEAGTLIAPPAGRRSARERGASTAAVLPGSFPARSIRARAPPAAGRLSGGKKINKSPFSTQKYAIPRGGLTAAVDRAEPSAQRAPKARRRRRRELKSALSWQSQPFGMGLSARHHPAGCGPPGGSWRGWGHPGGRGGCCGHAGLCAAGMIAR